MSMTLPNYGNALDAQSMMRLRADLKNPTPDNAKEVARQFESLFVKQMMTSMRDALPGDSLFGSEAQNKYWDIFDQQLSLDIARGQGLGLAPLIERQLLQQMGVSPENAQAGAPAWASEGLRRSTMPTQTPFVGPMPTRATPVVKPADAGTGPGAKGLLFDSPQAFIDTLRPMAEKAAEKLGVAADGILAQAALETGWGQFVIQDGAGRSSYNLFGIKAHRDWQGDTVTVPTLEFRDGVAKPERAAFRAYQSLEQAFNDYVRFLQSHPRYGEVLKAGDDAGAFAEGLQRAGYATDPNYADKIKRIAEQTLRRQDLAGLKFPADRPNT